MNKRRPVFDVRNNFTDISTMVHKINESILITKNVCDEMVSMGMEAFEDLDFESKVYFKLSEAEMEGAMTSERFFSKDVLKAMKEFMGSTNT